MLGSTLRDWRVGARYHQTDAAKALGCSPAFVCRLEAGKAPVNVRHVGRLAALYGVSAAEVGKAVLAAWQQ